MDRFRPPTKRDEQSFCDVCQTWKHYEEFPYDTDDCICIECADAIAETTTTTQEESKSNGSTSESNQGSTTCDDKAAGTGQDRIINP